MDLLTYMETSPYRPFPWDLRVVPLDIPPAAPQTRRVTMPVATTHDTFVPSDTYQPFKNEFHSLTNLCGNPEEKQQPTPPARVVSYAKALQSSAKVLPVSMKSKGPKQIQKPLRPHKDKKPREQPGRSNPRETSGERRRRRAKKQVHEPVSTRVVVSRPAHLSPSRKPSPPTRRPQRTKSASPMQLRDWRVSPVTKPEPKPTVKPPPPKPKSLFPQFDSSMDWADL
jgi:hypothetical protein